MRPGIGAQTGIHFPLYALSGNCVPELRLGMGCTFRLRALAESAIRNLLLEWDAVSQRGRKRKVHPTPDVNSGTRFPDTKKATQRGLHLIYVADAPMTSRASTPRRLPGDAERKVHREFRTSRRALNVLSVRAGLSEQATSHAAGQPGPTPSKDFQKSC